MSKDTMHGHGVGTLRALLSEPSTWYFQFLWWGSVLTCEGWPRTRAGALNPESTDPCWIHGWTSGRPWISWKFAQFCIYCAFFWEEGLWLSSNSQRCPWSQWLKILLLSYLEGRSKKASKEIVLDSSSNMSVLGVGFPTLPSHSQTPAGWPTIQLNSDAISLETASDSTD